MLNHYDRFSSVLLIEDESSAIVTHEKIDNRSQNKENGQNSCAVIDSESVDVDANDENDPLIIKYNRLIKRLDRLQVALHRLQKENDALKRNTIGESSFFFFI